jgi:GNAT superfamily N-acetyltransferase
MAERRIRPVQEPEKGGAVKLAWRVFLEFEAPEYSAEGVDEFRRFLDGIPANPDLKMKGCWIDGVLAGIIAVRPACHIALLFVDKAYHRQGVARLLWNAILADSRIVGGHKTVTVNSSPYAQPGIRPSGLFSRRRGTNCKWHKDLSP